MKTKISGIYTLSDPETNEIRYVGISSDIYSRYKKHCCNKSTNKHLVNWINRLKNNNVVPKLDIIEEINDLNKRQIAEQYYIKKYKNQGCNLINLTDGGEGIQGYKWSEESKKQISESLKGHEVKSETREKLRKAALLQHKNKPHIYTEEQKRKLSESRKGMKFSEEHRKNISLAQKGKKNFNKKGLIIIDNFGNEFISATKAAQFHNMAISTICRLVSGEMKTSSKGITFKRIK